MSCLRPSPPNCVVNSSDCPDAMGCPQGLCPDFQIKRHDTIPSLKIPVEDADGPIDLTGLVLEASMWVCAKLKTDILIDDTILQLADNVGFERIMIDDILVVDRVRSPEHMRIIGFDEDAKTIEVERAYNGTTASAWKKGTTVHIFRIFNAAAVTQMVYGDITQVDGCVLSNQLSESFLIYEWFPNDTCVPGCFWFEFKLLKMLADPGPTPSVTPVCTSGIGVEWVRRFPVCGEYLVKICESYTAEL